MPNKLTIEEFISRARKIHGNKYNYSKVKYINRTTKVCIICPKHGEFYQTPNGHFLYGCQQCFFDRNRINKIAKKKTSKEFVDNAIGIHGDKYDYSKTEYINAKTKVCITCPEHGDFWQLPYIHTKGIGCPTCGYEKASKSKTKTTEDFIKKAKSIHGDRYDYSLVDYKSFFSKVQIICPIHGIFFQTPGRHLSGCGCPVCNNSKGEKRINDFLETNRIKNIKQYSIINDILFCSNKRFLVDFYLPSNNIIIEYNGIQHYKQKEYFGGVNALEKQQERDMALRQYCKEHKIKLIEIPYTEYDNIETILNKELDIIKVKK